GGESCGRCEEEKRNLARNRVGQRGAPALVRNVDYVDAGPALQQLGRDVARRAATGRSVGVEAGALPRRSDQLAQRLRRCVRVRGDELRHAHQERNRGEVALDVVAQIVERWLYCV